MQKLVFINGNGKEIDLTSGNFGIVNWEGLANTALNIQTQQVPFEDGGVYLDALMEQREIAVTVAIYDGNNLELRYQKKRELISALNPKLGEGVLIYTNDYTSKQIHAVPQIPIFENKNSNDVGTLKASVAFTCPNPYWEDLEDKEVVFDITEQPIISNEGDVPVQLQMEWFTKGATNPSVTNVTTEKTIGYKNYLDKNLKINTQYGQKSVKTEALNFGISNYGSDVIDLKFIPFLNKFIKISTTGEIATSKDGTLWNYKESGTTQDLRGIVFNNYMVIVYGADFVLRSYNGEDWDLFNVSVITEYETIETATYNKDEDLFAFYSTDGENATFFTSQDCESFEVVSNVNYSYNAILYYISDLGLYVLAGGLKLYTTLDLINFSERTSTSAEVNDILYISEINKIIVIERNGDIATSADAISWTEQASGASNSLVSIVYAKEQNEIFILGDYGQIVTGSNGVNWSVYSPFVISGEMRQLNRIAYTEEKGLFLVNGEEGFIARSFGGRDWEVITNPISEILNDVAYIPEMKAYIAVGDNYTLLVSKDGVNYINAGEELDRAEYLFGVAFNPVDKTVIVVGYHRILTSSDLLNWEITENTYGLNKIICNDGKIVVAGNEGIYVGTSVADLDLVKATEDAMLDITYHNGKYIAVGNGGVILTSEDLTVWTEQTSGTTENLRCVSYFEKLNAILVGGENSVLLSSADGSDWENNDIISETVNINDFIYVYSFGGILIACDEGKIYYFIGSFITTLQPFVNGDLKSIAYNAQNDVCVIVGESALILSNVKESGVNEIQNITAESDMGLNLAIGDNQFRINKTSGEMVVRITYRQRYIGV